MFVSYTCLWPQREVEASALSCEWLPSGLCSFPKYYWYGVIEQSDRSYNPSNSSCSQQDVVEMDKGLGGRLESPAPHDHTQALHCSAAHWCAWFERFCRLAEPFACLQAMTVRTKVTNKWVLQKQTNNYKIFIPRIKGIFAKYYTLRCGLSLNGDLKCSFLSLRMNQFKIDTTFITM